MYSERTETEKQENLRLSEHESEIRFHTEKREIARRDFESSLEAERKKFQNAFAVIAEKDAEIAQLRAQLKKQKNSK